MFWLRSVGDLNMIPEPEKDELSVINPDPALIPEELVAVESEEVRNGSLEEIKSWLARNPDINARTDNATLLYFLRACKFDMERTKTKIQDFYLMRAERTEWFANRNPFSPEIQELLEIGVFLPLKDVDSLNRRVFVIRIAAHDPKRHQQNDVFKVGKMILDLALKFHEDTSIYGAVAIFDMKGVSLGHALQLSPTMIKHAVDAWKIYPCRTKVLEFIHTPIHVNVVLNTFRMFMTAKMKSRIVVRRGTSKASVVLPKELGGTGESYAELAKYWKNAVEQHVTFFEDDDKYKSLLRS